MPSTNTRFTALGMSGSGKTCYVLGMYYQMITGYKGFSLKSSGDNVAKLEDWMDMIDDNTGADRFPAGTNLTEITDYEFKLKYALKDIMTFNWVDYAGGTIRARDKNPEAYASLTASIEQSTALYIFIDGDLLCNDDLEESIRKIKRNARIINDYLQEFSEQHTQRIPPIVFVITKGDLCGQYIKNDSIKKIMTEAFGIIMTKGIRAYVVMVSLGEKISEDEYSGEVDPINMHLPFFIGIYHQFYAFCFDLMQQIKAEESRNNERIIQNRSEIDEIRNRGWLSRLINGTDTSSQLRAIENSQKTIRTNRELFDHYRKLMQAVSSQLLRDSKDFIVIEDGREVDFDPNDEMNALYI